MKQILQSLNAGATKIVEVPSPGIKRGHLLIRTAASLISSGTERAAVEFGNAGLLEKAMQQPDKVLKVLKKIKTDGLMPTVQVVRSTLDQILPLGYCNAGVVLEVGDGVTGFSAGDRVASNGHHAEIVSVPEKLCARIPDKVGFDEAALTVMSAIALQGIRLAAPTLGERFAVIGLGLLGQLTVQLLKANGCNVIAFDTMPERTELARLAGAETIDISEGADPVQASIHFSKAEGVDGVIITASSKSSEPIHHAAKMCRKRGRIIMVGVTGMEINRSDFYEKELSFQVSCSYGPGRYDPFYEEHGNDYPIAYVRWTEQRNFEAALDAMAAGSLNVRPLISYRFPLNEAVAAYQLLCNDNPPLGILLEYGDGEIGKDHTLMEQAVIVGQPATGTAGSEKPRIGFIGAGNYAMHVLIPAFKNAESRLKTVATGGGIGAVHAARKFGFDTATTDNNIIMKDPDIDVVVIATRHDSHARLVIDALMEKKHVFVEKPLAINAKQLEEIKSALEETHSMGRGSLLMVGFNRRFSPYVVKIKKLLVDVREPKSFIMTVNAGEVPASHWTQDPEIGGGRIIGEACHFIDLLRYLSGSKIIDIQTVVLGQDTPRTPQDRVSFTLRFVDGSFGVVHYLANGHKDFPKERLEIFCAGKILQLDDYRVLTGYGWPGFRKKTSRGAQKGNNECAKAFLEAIKHGKPSPIAFNEIIEVTEASFMVNDSVVKH